MKYIQVLIFNLLFAFHQSAFADQRETVQDIFLSSQEPTTKDAVWTADNIFKVGVVDDGSSRNGYASYVCEVLYEHGFKGKGIHVHVIDIVELTKNGSWKKLGQANCQ